MSLTGNVSHCALVDCRKDLLAKISPETLDLIHDRERPGFQLEVMESIPVDARAKQFGVCSTKKQHSLLRESPKTGLTGISKNIFIKPTASKPASPVQQFLVFSRLKIDFQLIAEGCQTP